MRNLPQARRTVLAAVIYDLVAEQLEMAADLGVDPKWEEVEDSAYEVLVANNDKNVVTHILDYTEDEVMEAISLCKQALKEK